MRDPYLKKIKLMNLKEQVDLIMDLVGGFKLATYCPDLWLLC